MSEDILEQELLHYASLAYDHSITVDRDREAAISLVNSGHFVVVGIDDRHRQMVCKLTGSDRATQTVPSYLRTFNAEQTKQLREDGIGANAPNPYMR